MEDNHRIAAARRAARRMSRRGGIGHQQALDAVARDLGRAHWAAFMADPVDVPRERKQEAPEAPASSDLDDDRWNVLSARMLPDDGEMLAMHIRRVADTLSRRSGGSSGFFEDKGRSALEGLLGIEVSEARAEGRTASVGAMTRWLHDRVRDAQIKARQRADGKDHVGDCIDGMLARYPDSVCRTGLEQLVDTSVNERSSILGEVDRSLMAYIHAEAQRTT